MSTKKEFWSKLVGEDWYLLFPEFWESSYMTNLLKLLSQRYKQATVFPEQKDIFKAFKLCRVKNFKVLILGQDPYPDGSATGLAFANKDKIKLSPSLQKMYETIERDCYDGLKIVFDESLETWAEQGVLLLNTALTIEKFKTTSHSEYWKVFTKSFLKRLSESHLTGIHVCLWGNHAKSFKPYLNDKTMYIYEALHPASASYNNIDWECNHFKEINMKIVKQNNDLNDIIAW